MTGAVRSDRRILAALFFLSGSTALVYEVIWFKRFAQVWGSSSQAMAAVVAAFLLGLGLGAKLLGTRASRVRSPLTAYALCELAIAAFALVSLFEIELLRSLTGTIYQTFGNGGLPGVLARLLLAFCVLGPPTILMGATLPLLVGQLDLEGIAAGAPRPCSTPSIRWERPSVVS